MQAMAARRRETVAADMEPEAAQAFLASPPPKTPDPGVTVALDPDADPNDLEAEAERARLIAAASEVDTSAATQVAQQTDDILAEDDLARLKVRRKVNGVETVVPVGDVLRDAQKVAAADDFLAQAKNTLREVNTVAEQVRTAAAGGKPTESAPTPTTPGDTSPDAVDGFVEALFQGDEQRAKDLLRKAGLQRDTSAAAAPSGDAIAAAVEQRIVIRNGLRQFAKDHKEIAADEVLQAKAQQFLMQETGGKSLYELDPDRIPEVLDAAGRKTKEWLREKAGVPVTQPTVSAALSDRRAQKAAIDDPALASASARAASTVPQARTASDVISGMRALRQPQQVSR